MTFMSTVGSSYDVSNDVLFRQEDKDFHQVKSWSPTQQLVIGQVAKQLQDTGIEPTKTN